MIQAFEAAPGLTSIDRLSLREAAVRQIRAAIARGELRAGQRITELGIGKRLAVGQATIREAFIELEHQGFIQRCGPRRTCVSVLTRREINDIYVLRTRLETLAVELLVESKTRSVPEADGCYRQMLAAAEAGNWNELCEADLGFHRALWHATGNHSLVEVMERLVPKLFAFGIIQRARPPREKLLELAERHGELLRLIQAGELEPAKELMESSMRQAWRADLQLLEGNANVIWGSQGSPALEKKGE